MTPPDRTADTLTRVSTSMRGGSTSHSSAKTTKHTAIGLVSTRADLGLSQRSPPRIMKAIATSNGTPLDIVTGMLIVMWTVVARWEVSAEILPEHTDQVGVYGPRCTETEHGCFTEGNASDDPARYP